MNVFDVLPRCVALTPLPSRVKRTWFHFVEPWTRLATKLGDLFLSASWSLVKQKSMYEPKTKRVAEANKYDDTNVTVWQILLKQCRAPVRAMGK